MASGKANGAANQSSAGNTESAHDLDRLLGQGQTHPVCSTDRAATPGCALWSSTTPAGNTVMTMEDTQANKMCKEFVANSVNID